MDKKTFVLARAREIAHKEGLKNLTIRRLAQEADISIGSVYNIVGSKEDLIFNLIEGYWKESMEEIVGLEPGAGGNFLASLEEIYREFKGITDSFHKDWIRDMVGFHMANERVIDLSSSYQHMVQLKIGALLQGDDQLRDIWEPDFSQEDLAEFIFENIMILLGNGSQDLGFLGQVLEKLLY